MLNSIRADTGVPARANAQISYLVERSVFCVHARTLVLRVSVRSVGGLDVRSARRRRRSQGGADV